jgi:methionyl aminopeptidase
MFTRIKTDKEIEAMRIGGQMLASVLQYLKPKVAMGVSTKDLANWAAKEMRSIGAEPAFLGFQGFPDVICISVNDEIVHGIPKETHMIKEGDVVKLDLGVVHKGMVVDGAISVICGLSTQPKDDLLLFTEQALTEGLAVVQGGVRIGDIGYAIEKVLSQHKLGVVRDLVGHGVGHNVHEEPNIPNYGRKNTGPALLSGMTVAIEPMSTLGAEGIITDDDGWTVRTIDGSLAAQFEHTVLITESGCEILTIS